MKRLEWYIFRQSAVSFAMVLSILTLVLWLTQALREFDLVTGKGQGIVIFLTMTLLSIPQLLLVIAPIALMIAVIYTLNRLNGDSELVVMTSAGISRWFLMRPFLYLTLIVALSIGATSLYLAPVSQNNLRFFITKVRADLIANIMRAGEFASVADGLVFHVRSRGPNGLLLGIFVSDSRNSLTKTVYLAEQGQITETAGGTYLIMSKGLIQRSEKPNDDTGANINTASNTNTKTKTDTGPKSPADPAIIEFEQYAFDLSQLTKAATQSFFKAAERPTDYLFNPDPKDPVFLVKPGSFRAELHGRFAAPLYPIALALIVFACLGQPQTTRQGRGFSILLAICLAAIIRMLGFAASGFAIKSASAIILIYMIPLGAIILAMLSIANLLQLRLPDKVRGSLEVLFARLDTLTQDLAKNLANRFTR